MHAIINYTRLRLIVYSYAILMKLVPQHFLLGVQDLTDSHIYIPVIRLIIANISYVFCCS
jgi:hypothetical protein